MRDPGGIYKSATPNLCRHSKRSALFESQMLLRDQELLAAVVPSLCRHSDPAPAGEESRAAAACHANALSSRHPESTNVGAGFSLPRVSKGHAPGPAHAIAGAHGNGRPREPFFQLPSTIIKTTTNLPFLIAWLIANAKRSRAALSAQKFNGIQNPNRSYFVCFRGGPKSHVFSSFFRSESSVSGVTEQSEGAVN
jgi:hypothetical protein